MKMYIKNWRVFILSDNVYSPLVSVIVPVYNVKKYLDRCIESIINQTYQNLEIILVDDGSTDGSSIMCDLWANKDDRLHVIHKENGGLSSARNAGIDKAGGKFLVFIDSDDQWLKNDFLERCINILKITNDKVLLFGYQEISENCRFIPKVDFSCVNDHYKSYDSGYCVKNNLFFSSAWTKMIETDLVRDNNIYFRPHVHSEDIEWSAKILSINDSYSVYPLNVYGYYQNSESITHNVSVDDILTLIENINHCLQIVNKTKVANENAFYNYIAYQYITALNLYLRYAKKNKKIKNILRESKGLLEYHQNRKVCAIYKCNKYCGFNMMLESVYWFLKIRKNGR